MTTECTCITCEKQFFVTEYKVSIWRGKYCSRACCSLSQVGKKHSDETKRRMSVAGKGKKRPPFSEKWRENMSKSKKGKKAPWAAWRTTPTNLGMKLKWTEESYRSYHEKRRDTRWPLSHNWIEDRTKLQRYWDDTKDRRSYAYSSWRKQVWERDNYKCKISNCDCEWRIEAHHILSWHAHPELRFDINNWITLCHKHHPRKRIEEEQMIPTYKNLIITN